MSVAPRLRANAAGLIAFRHRLRKSGGLPFIVQPRRVNPRSVSSQALLDEPLLLRDSQFDYPQVRILPLSAIQIVLKF